MPCSSDYMEPTAREIESRKVNKLLAYILPKMGMIVPADITYASEYIYGKPDTLDADTDLMCKLCGSLDEEKQNEIIYNGRDKMARQLADWWENHQEFDRVRTAEEKRKAKLESLKENILAKLTDEEKEALGL